MAKLILKFRDRTLREIPITKSTITIGRVDDNDIKIENLGVSRNHTKIMQEGDHYVIEDLNSLNGTFVNDRKVMKGVLRNKDEILIGKHTLVFIDDEEKPLEARQSVPSSFAEETFVLDTKKVQEFIAQQPGGRPSSEATPSELEGEISIISGGVGQRDIKLTKRLTVGGKGESADIKLRGLFVGKTAFIISKGSGGFSISHSGGRRITRVNSVAVEGRRDLQDGDIIKIGATIMQFHSKT